MLSVSGLTGYQVNASEEPKHLDILFTHDLHSHLNSFQTIVDGTQQETGGFARLKTLINEHEKENTDTLILDGGDFSMGTRYRLYMTQRPPNCGCLDIWAVM